MANTKITTNVIADDAITTAKLASGLTLGGNTTLSGSLTGTSATFTTADNTSQLTLKSTDADASVGPRFDLTRDSSSPAASDMLGQIRWLGEDSADSSLSYAHMTTYIEDATDGAEDGKFEIDTRIAGTSRSRLLMHSTATVFNQEGLGVDFRVESNNNANMFVVDASEDAVGIGIATPAAELHVNSTGENINLRLTRDTSNGIILTGTDGTNPAFRVSTIASGTATERLVLNPTGLYPYTDAGLELGDANNRWNRLEVKSTTSGNIAFVGEKTSAAGSFRTVEVITTLSGSDATGADVANYGIYNQIDSSATGGDTSDEHRVYGMRNIVKVTGDSDIVYGSYSQAEAEHSSGQVTNLYGAYNYAVADTNSGATVQNLYGAYNYGLAQGSSGSTITNIFASYNKAITTSADDIGHSSITAVYAEIENDDSGQQNTTTTGYLFRGNYDDDSGTNNLYTNFYGLHIGGSGLSGNLTGSGDSAGVYLDLAGADVGFWNSEDQLNYFRGSLGIGSGAKNVANTVGMELHLVEPQGGDMILARNDSATTTDEVLGRIFFGATEDSGNTVNYNASIEAYAGGPNSASDSEGYLAFKTTPNSSTTLTERIRIKSDGTVGIGTITPTNVLDTAFTASAHTSGISITNVQTGGWGSTLAFNSRRSDGGQSILTAARLRTEGSESWSSDGSSSSNMIFETRSNNTLAERMRLSATGQLIIANQAAHSTSTKLHIEGGSSGTTSPIVYIADGDGSVEGGSTLLELAFDADDSFSSANYVFFTDSGGTQGEIRGTGDGTVTYDQTSDERLKDNIRDTDSKWDMINAIQVRDFEWKRSGNTNTAFIAQELHSVYPEAAYEGGEDPKTDPWSINYGRLTPVLTKALQEAMARIESLEAEVEALKGE